MRDGKPSVLLSIIKNGDASTLTVVNAVKHMLIVARAAAPPGMVIKSLFDQSVFVASSVVAVLREGAIAAGLTALMILLIPRFLAADDRRDDLDPAGDADLARRALFSRRDDQYDDFGRACARGRHSRRQLDGDDREHLPPA